MVLRKGYMIGDGLLRTAMVIIDDVEDIEDAKTDEE